MTNPADAAEPRSRYWLVPVLRAVPAAVVALIITFSANHAAGLGLVLFATFAVVDGLILELVAAGRVPTRRDALNNRVQGAIEIVLAIVAVLLIGAGVAGFKWVAVVFGLVVGGLELANGLASRRDGPFARDWQTIGGLGILLAIVVALTPTGYRKALGGIEHVQGTLDASVIVVGFLGAYLALTAVFHIIAGLSHKWGTAATQPSSPNGAPPA
ncbi:hypothetical protein [Curtobacterium ammoniigenes]|uniref:hypothetical protein n=1 Tax=Curtobacterium ammoniigenes TaxID=395387 RepID=UPI00082AD4F5|nr:hypothetical protein [Curtobacterium ammoniigenes]